MGLSPASPHPLDASVALYWVLHPASSLASPPEEFQTQLQLQLPALPLEKPHRVSVLTDTRPSGLHFEAGKRHSRDTL